MAAPSSKKKFGLLKVCGLISATKTSLSSSPASSASRSVSPAAIWTWSNQTPIPRSFNASAKERAHSASVLEYEINTIGLVIASLRSVLLDSPPKLHQVGFNIIQLQKVP